MSVSIIKQKLLESIKQELYTEENNFLILKMDFVKTYDPTDL